MAKLRRQLKDMKKARVTQRSSRRVRDVPSVAIAGYTNAGKSSLLNRLTGAGVLVEDSLFATLDPKVRRTETPDGRTYTMTDTVGFVRHLPHQLVEAFRSTLEEVAEADLVLHVVDASQPDPEQQLVSVREVFAELEAFDVPELVVINKSDLADPVVLERLRLREPQSVVVSARTGEGLEELRELISVRLPRPAVPVDVLVPYARGDLVSRMHDDGDIDKLEHMADGTRITGRVSRDLAADLAPYAAPAGS